jgi:hypothetical protein
MEDGEILSRVAEQLKPVEVQEWFLAVESQARDAVLTVAKVDGIHAAVRGVKELYLAWLVNRKESYASGNYASGRAADVRFRERG